MSKNNKNFYFKKQRAGLVLVGGFVAIIIGFTTTGTFAGLVASIHNSVNTAVTGYLEMTETSEDGRLSCRSTEDTANTATCATINKYGGETTPLAPGGSQTTTIKIGNTGTIDATSFTIKGGPCRNIDIARAPISGTGNICEKINVEIKVGDKTVFAGTAKAFQDRETFNMLGSGDNKIGKNTIAKGSEETITIKVSLPADARNEYQGKKIDQPITWQFGA